MEKSEILPKDIKWHLIGHLQSGKCNQLIRKIPNLWVIESVDSIKLAEKLNSACLLAERADPLNVFVEVHTSDEESYMLLHTAYYFLERAVVFLKIFVLLPSLFLLAVLS